MDGHVAIRRYICEHNFQVIKICMQTHQHINFINSDNFYISYLIVYKFLMCLVVATYVYCWVEHYKVVGHLRKSSVKAIKKCWKILCASIHIYIMYINIFIKKNWQKNFFAL